MLNWIYINPNGRIIRMTIEHTKCMWIESNKIIEYSISMQRYSFIFSLAAQVAQNLWAMEKRWVCMTMIPQTTTITNGLCGFTRFFISLLLLVFCHHFSICVYSLSYSFPFSIIRADLSLSRSVFMRPNKHSRMD